MNPALLESGNRMWVFILFLWTRLIGPSDQSGLDGYKLLTVFAKTSQDVRNLRHVKNTFNLDPWKEAVTVNSTGDYLVSPDHLHDVINTLSRWNLGHEERLADVSGFLKNQTFRTHVRRKRNTDLQKHYRFRYLSLDEINQFLHYVQHNAKTAHVQINSIGRSFEGRETPYAKISRQSKGKKPILFIDAGIHAREWISPAMAVEMIHRLALNPERDPNVSILLDRFDWLIVPVVNPDGYDYSFRPEVGTRLWRKSRAVHYHQDPRCYGVDLNRNFGFAWNDDPIHGGSSNPCSGIYSGPSSFSEPETRNVRDLLLSNKDAIRGYISLHSFGQFFLYPWGYSSQVDLDDEMDLHQVATAFANTMKSRNYHYNVGATAKTLYPASGGSDDYVRGTVGVKYAYIVELPPHETSRFGFLLPEAKVKDTVTDTWAGLQAFAHQLHQKISRNRAHTRSMP